MKITKPISEYIADFRYYLSEFDEQTYPDDAVELALTRTKKWIGTAWGEYRSPPSDSWARDGWFSRAAHVLMVSKEIFDAVAAGDIPSPLRGIDSTTIADESLTFGSQIMLKLSPWNEQLNATSYGVDFLEMRATIETKSNYMAG
ncbi:hypothetical protein P5E67_05005 [Vibrio parahaemolyticus]|nr:hypothetical protein [Vibrio parahaemolyticus]